LYKRLKDYEGNGKGLFADILTKKYLTKKLNNEKYAVDALVFGATLLGDSVEQHSIPSQYKRYKLKCGHVSEHKFTHVRAGLFRCNECKQRKYKQEAELAGLEIIANNPVENTDYKLYKFKTCGHEKLLTSWNVTNLKHGACFVCEEAQRHADADRNGLELIDLDDMSKWMNKNYKYKSCGHIKSIRLQDVAKNDIPKCIECRTLKWKEEAKIAGIEFIGLSSSVSLNENLEYDYRLPCGCVKAMKTGNVRRNVWACDNHSNYYSKASTVYLLEFSTDNFRWLKLGFSSRLERRISDYKMKVPYVCEHLYVVNTSSNREAITYEKAFHASHKLSKLNYNSMKEFMTNGGNECYPMSMKDYLICTLMDFEKELNGDS